MFKCAIFAEIMDCAVPLILQWLANAIITALVFVIFTAMFWCWFVNICLIFTGQPYKRLGTTER